MSGTRAKIIADKQKYIIQIDGDSSNYADFQENEMNLIAIGPGSKKVEAVFNKLGGSSIFTVSFADQIEISKNMLDQGFYINIDNSGDILLDSSTVRQFGLAVGTQMNIKTVRDWSMA